MSATLHIRKRDFGARIHLPFDANMLMTRCGLSLNANDWECSEDIQPGDVLCLWCQEADKRGIDRLTNRQKEGIASGWTRRESRMQGERERHLEAQIERAAPVLAAADAWARAIAAPDGVHDAEQALVKAVETWREQ